MKKILSLLICLSFALSIFCSCSSPADITQSDEASAHQSNISSTVSDVSAPTDTSSNELPSRSETDSSSDVNSEEINSTVSTIPPAQDDTENNSNSSSNEDVSVSTEIRSDYTDSVLGDVILLKAVTSGAEPLVNNSGMSGLWSGNHLHAGFNGSTSSGRNYISECMYSTNSPSEIVFDAGKIQMFGKMFIWNYNDTADLNSGLKSVDIYYSKNGSRWEKLDTYILARCVQSDNDKHGGNISTNINGTNMPIDFGGIAARYLKIVPRSNWGGSKYGLSEVRLFRHKATPGSGDLIFSNAFAPQNALAMISGAENSANNSGMSTLDNSPSATHSSSAEDMWLCLDSADNSVLVFDLDGNYPISSVTLWNYNAAGATNYGLRNFEIYYCYDSPYELKQNQGDNISDSFNWHPSDKDSNWQKVGGTYTLSPGTGEDGMSSSLTISFNNVHAQFIKIVPNSNWGGTSTGFGLSEVRINCGNGWIVEPSRYWTGVLSSSGTFAYQGNNDNDPFAKSGDAGSGWMGGDGFFTTSLTGDNLQGQINSNSKTFATFQDSFIGRFGNYRNFTFTQGYAYSDNFSIGMKNMAYLFVEGDKPDVRNVQFEHSLDVSNNHSLGNIFPNNDFGTGYWTGDSTVVDGKLYSIATCIQNGWGTNFRWILSHKLGSDGLPDMSSVPTVVLKNSSSETINEETYPIGENRALSNEYFSADQIYEEGDYLYLFGKMRGTGWLTDGQNVMVARVKKNNFSTLADIEYWNGSNWSLSMATAAPISDSDVGNEFNVTYCTSGPYAGKYVCVYTEGSIGGKVCISVSDTLTGTYTRPDDFVLYYAAERYMVAYRSYTEEAYFADTTSNKASYYTILSQWNYNAKAQPALSKEGELLITYHFGTHDDRTPSWGYFGAVNKEYEHPTFISLKSTENY